MALSVGTQAPDFTLKSKTPTGLVDIKLSENFHKKNTVLLFFPAAFTGVCTQELCAISAGVFNPHSAISIHKSSLVNRKSSILYRPDRAMFVQDGIQRHVVRLGLQIGQKAHAKAQSHREGFR